MSSIATHQIPTAKRPLSLLEWVIVIFIFYNVIVIFPFYGKAFFWGENWTVKAAAYFVLIFAFVVEGHRTRNIHRLLNDRWVFLFLVTYCGYLLILMISTFLHYRAYINVFTGGIYDSSSNTVGFLLLCCSALIMAMSIRMDLFRWIMDRYVDLMVLCSIGAILIVIMVYFFNLPPLMRVPLLGDGASNLTDQQAYMDFYGIGFSRHAASIAGLKIPRAQSFAAEGAGFAYPLVIALIWAMFRNRLAVLLILLLAFILTWSVGAFLTLGLVTLLTLATRRVKGMVYLLGLIILLLVGYISGTFTEVFDLYWGQKFNTVDSSGACRMDALRAIMKTISDGNYLGLGIGSMPFVIPTCINTSLSSAFAATGILGVLLWLTAYLIIGIRMILAFISNDREAKAIASCTLVLYLMSIQALGLDVHVISWFVLAGLMIKITDNSNESPTKVSAPTRGISG